MFVVTASGQVLSGRVAFVSKAVKEEEVVIINDNFILFLTKGQMRIAMRWGIRLAFSMSPVYCPALEG